MSSAWLGDKVFKRQATMLRTSSLANRTRGHIFLPWLCTLTYCLVITVRLRVVIRLMPATRWREPATMPQSPSGRSPLRMTTSPAQDRTCWQLLHRGPALQGADATDDLFFNKARRRPDKSSRTAIYQVGHGQPLYCDLGKGDCMPSGGTTLATMTSYNPSVFESGVKWIPVTIGGLVEPRWEMLAVGLISAREASQVPTLASLPHTVK
ncbi:hypothetical protein A9K55_004701 [Cordyceps militaris]|uniref:Uncharacterized protein n=1 Tax=Cordyceps militaris TaxID=73501 RepID=A0A2H4SQ09_CORMI|nr:hypothetical protein A9K55_004701 [Cordyceps militaris]